MIEAMTTRQKLVLIVAILASGVAFLDGSIVNVALPAMQRSLGGGLAMQQWVVDAYLVTLGALMLIAGSLSDLFGRHRVLLWGLGGFLVASLACAFAPTAGALIAARAAQGVAGALLVPSSLAIIMSTFEGDAKGKAIGTWTAWTGIAFVIGPLLGGFLVDAASWRLVFAINVVPILLTMALIGRISFTHDTKAGVSVDYVGALLCAVGLGAAVFGLIEQPRWGWHDPLVTGSIIVGVAALGGFLWFETRTRHPMLPLGLFRNRNFSAGNVATAAIYGSLSMNSLLIVLFLQQVGGFSALHAGLALLPITILLFLLSPRFGGLAGRLGPRWFMASGPLLMAGACLLFWRMSADVRYVSDVLPGVLLFGFGLSMTVAPLTSAVLGDIEPGQAGIASAVNNAVSRVAGLVAVAAIGSVLAVQFHAQLGSRLGRQGLTHQLKPASIQLVESRPLDLRVPADVPPAARTPLKQALESASVDGLHLSLVIMSASLALGGVVSALFIRNHRPAA